MTFFGAMGALVFAQPAAAAAAPVPPPLPAPPAPIPEPASPEAQPPVIPFASLAEGMGVRSGDGNYSAGVHLLLQTRYEHVESDRGREDGFRIVVARPAFRGVAFRPWVKYFIQFEVAGTPSLLDAEILVQPVPEIGLKVGQFLTPFSREFLIPQGALLFPDFAPSNVAFRNNRDIGAMLVGSLFENHVEYFAAAVNGNGTSKDANDNAELEWMARLAANVFGKSPYTESPQLSTSAPGLTLGINASYGETEQTTTSIDPATGTSTTTRHGSSPTTKLGADVSFHAGPLSVQSEAYARTIGAVAGVAQPVARGGFAQAGVFVLPKMLELAVRGDLIDTDIHRAASTSKRFDGGINYYVVNDHLKLQARYAWADAAPAAAGKSDTVSHTVTLQGQVWF